MRLKNEKERRAGARGRGGASQKRSDCVSNPLGDRLGAIGILQNLAAVSSKAAKHKGQTEDEFEAGALFDGQSSP
jgi:hypothetical protein